MAKTLKQTFRTNLELRELEDGLYVDQYGRLLEAYTDKKGQPELRPVGIYGKGRDA